VAQQGDLEEEHDHGARPEEVHGEHAALRRGAEGEVLLGEEEPEQDKGEDEEGDDAARVPGVQHAAERDGHDDGHDEPDNEHDAEEVDLKQALLDALA
jgi:hypothetical protein